MNRKTTAFLNELVSVCLSHGVRLSGPTFVGNGVRDLSTRMVAKAIAGAEQDYEEPSLFLVWRDSARLGRRWLRGNRQWCKNCDKARIRSFTLPQARRLIRQFRKVERGDQYAYGISSVFGRDHIVVR